MRRDVSSLENLLAVDGGERTFDDAVAEQAAFDERLRAKQRDRDDLRRVISEAEQVHCCVAGTLCVSLFKLTPLCLFVCVMCV